MQFKNQKHTHPWRPHGHPTSTEISDISEGCILNNRPKIESLTNVVVIKQFLIKLFLVDYNKQLTYLLVLIDFLRCWRKLQYVGKFQRSTLKV